MTDKQTRPDSAVLTHRTIPAKIVRRTTVRGTLLVALAAILFAFSGICAQYLTQQKSFSPMWLASVRILIGGTLLSSIGITQNRKGFKALLKNKKDILFLVLFGIFGLMLAQFTYIMAVETSNAPTSTVLQYIGPIFIIFFVCIRGKRLPRITEFISIILAAAGVFILSTHGNIGELAISGKTLAYGLASAVGLACYSLLPVKIIPKYGSLMITGLGMICGGIVLLFIARPWNIPVSFDLMSILAFIGLAIMGTTVGYTLYMQGVSDIGSVKAGMICCLEPMMSAIMATFLGTRLMVLDYLGMACIVATVFILSIPPKTEKVSFSPLHRHKK